MSSSLDGVGNALTIEKVRLGSRNRTFPSCLIAVSQICSLQILKLQPAKAELFRNLC